MKKRLILNYLTLDLVALLISFAFSLSNSKVFCQNKFLSKDFKYILFEKDSQLSLIAPKNLSLTFIKVNGAKSKGKIKKGQIFIDKNFFNDTNLIDIIVKKGNLKIVFKNENPKILLKSHEISIYVFNNQTEIFYNEYCFLIPI